VGVEGSEGVGDALLTYRYQFWTESGSRPAFAPRISLVLPTGGRRRGLDTLGYVVNLPFSRQVENLYFHWNAGFVTFPRTRVPESPDHRTLFSPLASASVIWRARPLIHPLIEALFVSEDSLEDRTATFVLSPGIRVGRNLGDRQLVFGAALPVTFRDDGSDGAILLYLSYELPFRR
jgi:hypothetical protein